jgi:peptidoglycan-N-acetylglucosamine deacetylase
MKFTTSWDDGYALDTRIADMLSAHGAKGTFYICPDKQHGKDMLSKKEIQALASNHELGAHTMGHPKLTRISEEQAKKEIVDSKKWIENQSGKPCTMFCYPYGDSNASIEKMVQEEGFKGARGTAQMRFQSDNIFCQNTSLQIVPFPWRKTRSRPYHFIDPLGPLRVKMSKIISYNIPLKECTNWLSFAKALFSYAQKTNQPYFHLWGHSHELEKYNMWNDLDAFLAHVEKSGVECVLNSSTV